ncbi:hypothetical protein [Actinotalea solisilvae]|uniref:hypothetical protein n=1 Tax=Actinotalea solisilvae TaxID=2072922 RepID=UPI0018F1D4A4|nr:hypothetical protein [Actinotalea solisilvae]
MTEDDAGGDTPPTLTAAGAPDGLEPPSPSGVSFDVAKTVGSSSLGWQRTQTWAASSEARFAPPPGYRVVVVDTKSCSRVRDLASLRRDLELARLFAETYLDRASSRPEGGRFPDDAQWMSALVMYGRAFGSSVRASERLTDDWLKDDERASHRFLLDMRNKFVAHAVNNFEHAVVVAYLADSAFERRNISRLGQMHAEILPVSEDRLLDLVGLCKRFVIHINRRLRAALSDVERELRALGLDEVYAMPDLAPPEIDLARVAKRRR